MRTSGTAGKSFDHDHHRRQSSHPPTPREERELIPTDSPLSPYVSVNPGWMHGEPCFKEMRVPIQRLFDCLHSDESLSAFLMDFPDVPREQVAAVIGLAARGLLEGLRELRKQVSPCSAPNRKKCWLVSCTGTPVPCSAQCGKRRGICAGN